MASTSKGICHLFFEEDEKLAFAKLRAWFTSATYHQIADKFQQVALFIFRKDWQQLGKIKLYLNGTPFQLKVWESLSTIPEGRLTTYGKLAETVNRPKATRAVGTAIDSNPVAFLIPCHRIIQTSGYLGGCRCTTRKSTLNSREAARLEAAMSGE